MEQVTEQVLALRGTPDAAPEARSALRALLTGTPFAHRLDDGELALSELITNAVLHGRSPILLRLVLSDRHVRVEVGDASTVSPSFSMLDPTAVTGRGLVLISAVSDRWGVEPDADGKRVWFELHAGERTEAEADVDALLASWGDDLDEDPALEQVRVVITDLDTELLAGAEAHVEGQLRELSLLAGHEDLSEDLARVIRSALRAAAGIEPVRRDLKHQLSVAVSSGQRLVDICLTVQRDDAELVRDFSHAMDEADRLSRSGTLLSTATPPELSAARQGYLRRLLNQLSS